jgi:hypothetical protein
MRTRLALLTCAPVLLYLLARPAPEPAAGDGPSADPELRELARVFRAADDIDVRRRKWVVAESRDNPSWSEQGWLTAGQRGVGAVFTASGSPWEFGNPTGWAVRDGDFAAFCAAFLAAGAPDPSRSHGPEFTVNSMMLERAACADHILSAARLACWADARARPDLALRLLAHARTARERYAGIIWQSDRGTLLGTVAEVVAGRLRSGAIYGAHTGTPRPELVRRWQRIAAIPHHRHADEARRVAAHYAGMVAEDRAWREPDPAALAGMAVAQKAEYWLYHLRDLDTGQLMDPGSCSVFDSPFDGRNRTAPNPAEELRKLGFEALPQVVARLDDPRPTRCQGHWRSYAPDSFYLLTYGDCCEQIFTAVTGYAIYERTTTVGTPTGDGRASESKARAEQWLAELRRKGERQMIIDAVTAADGNAYGAAFRLVEKYPADAFDTLLRGAGNATDGRVRQHLLMILAGLKDDRVPGVMLAHLKDPVLRVRVDAAIALHDRGRPEGFAALVAEWRGLRADEFETGGSGVDEFAVGMVVRQLVRSHRPEGIEALRAGLRQRPLFLRWRVVQDVGWAGFYRDEPQLPDDARRAVERLLVESLADTEDVGNSRSMWVRGATVETPHRAVGDLAAVFLADRWERRQDFDPVGDYHTRRRQKAALANEWRRREGLHPLPLPELPRVTPAPAERVAALLAATAWDADRPKALAALEALGLAALPAVRAHLAALPADRPDAVDLRVLAARLRAHVQEVEFVPDGIPPTPELRDRFLAWRGQRLTASDVTEAVLWAADRLPAGAFGVHVGLEHAGDATGLTVVVTVAAKRPLNFGGPRKHWQLSERWVVAGKATGDGAKGKEEPFSADDLAESAAGLQALLDGPPDRPFSVRLGISVDQR